MNIMTNAWPWLLDDEVWLPKNVTWQEVDALPHYPKINDLKLAVVLALAFTVMRFLLNRILYIPIGTALGVRSKSAQVPTIPLLETAYIEKNINKFKIQQLSLELNWTVKQVEIWLRRRKQSVTPIKKFVESAWRLTCYTGFVVYGAVVLWDGPCSFNISDCFHPAATQQIPTTADRWYPLLELGFYISLSMSMLNDVKRKDFKMMVLHHVYTIILISFSWLINALRLSNLVMLCHDIADVPMEVGKLIGIVKKDSFPPACFVLFLVAWVVGRLVYFPFLVFGCIMYGKEYTGPLPYFLLNGLLVCLFQLHLLWTWMIIKILRKTFVTKAVVDIRSDDESCSDNETQRQKSK